jgi:multiple sugar transport system permease protein
MRHISYKTKKTALKWLSFTAAAVIALVMAIPFFWMISCALQPGLADIFKWPPRLLPVPPVFGNFMEAIKSINMPLLFKNTMILVVCNVALQVISSILVAYGFARFKAPGSKALFYILLSTMMLPWVVTMVPAYVLFLKLDWVGTFLPLIVPSIGGSAFFIFMMRQFLLALPRDLDEAAKIDGCSNIGILFKILLPLCRPVLATMVIFAFINNWSDFVGPSIYLTRQSMQTLSIGLQYFRSTSSAMPWHLVMAASTLFSIPMILVFFFAQNAFTKGIVTTGIKG